MKPLISLMDRLSLLGKFAAIGGLFVVATVYLTYSLYQSNQTNIDFSLKERAGAAYMEPLAALLSQVEAYAMVLARAAVGDAGAKPAVTIKAIDEQVAKLAVLDQRLGDLLATHESWQGIAKAWAVLRTAPANIDSARRAAELGNKLVALGGQVCDNSNLTLDPDIDSYYLMDAACSRLPTLMIRLGEQGRIAAAAVAAKQLGPAERTRLIELRPLAADAIGAMHGNYDKAFAYNAAIKAPFAASVASLEEKYQHAGSVVAAQALGVSLGAGAEQVAVASNTAIGQAVQLAEQTRIALDRLLVLRVEHMRDGRNLYVALALATLMGTVLLLAAMYRSLVGQLGGEPRYAFEVIQEIARGRLDTAIKLKSGDRGSLLAAMQVMRNQLRDVVTSTLSTAASIARASGQLTLTSDAIAASSHIQSEAAVAMASAVEQLTESISNSAGNAHAAKSLSEQASEASDSGDAVIRCAVVAMNGIADTVRSSAGAIRELNECSRQIGQVVAVIREVADQTNLLALNAAIEAARAGDSGHGFAVVADEVRKLAERTAISTTEINKMIDAIQRGTRSVSASMDREVHEVDSGVAHASQASQAITAIRDRIGSASEAVGDISDALREQRMASTTVAQNIEKIAEMSADNNRAVQEALRSAQRLNELAGGLKASVAFFHVGE